MAVLPPTQKRLEILDLARRSQRLRSEGSYHEALRLAEESVRLCRQSLTERDPDYVAILNNLAILCHALGDYSRAEPLMVETLTITRKTSGARGPDYATFLNNLAELYHAMGDFSRAEPLFVESAKLTRETVGRHHPDYAASLNNLAMLYRSMGDFARTEPLLVEARNIWKGAELYAEYAACLDNLAGLYCDLGTFARAESLYLEARDIRQRVLGEQHPHYATTLNNLAHLYIEIGNYKRAESLLIEARDVYRCALGERHPSYSTTIHNLAVLYRDIGDLDRAAPLFDEALANTRHTSGGLHSADYAKILHNAAMLHAQKGEFGRAEPLLAEAREIHRLALGEEHTGYAVSLNNIACLYMRTGDVSKAESLLTEARTITQTILGGRHPNHARNLSNLATLYYEIGDCGRAEPLLLEAQEILKSTVGAHHSDYGSNQQGLAAVCAATKHWQKAFDLYCEVAAIQNGLISHIFAFASERQRMLYLRKVRRTTHEFLSLVLAHFATSSFHVGMAFELVLHRKGLSAEVLAVQRDSVWIGKYPHLAPLLREVAILRAQIARRILEGPQPGDGVQHLQLLTTWQSRREQIEQQLAREIPEMGMQEMLRKGDRHAVASVLPDSASLIEFARLEIYDFGALPGCGELRWKPARYAAFILSKAGVIKMVDLGEAKPIDDLTTTFREAISGKDESGRFQRSPRSTSPRSEMSSLGQPDSIGVRLRKLVVDPLLSAVGDNRRIVIAPDDKLCLLPFEALCDEQRQYLVDIFEISYVSTGRQLVRLQDKSTGRPAQSNLVAADPDFMLAANSGGGTLPETGKERPDRATGAGLQHIMRGSGIQFRPLPATRKEGERIAKLLRSDPILGGDVLESRLKQCCSPRILHLATHGFFLPRLPSNPNREEAFAVRFDEPRLRGPGMENPLLRSGLALAGAQTWIEGGSPPEEAEDGLLTAEDVTGMDLIGTEMVVLSACDTGIGEALPEDGVFGLRRAFELAGARTLIMSMWKVPDDLTGRLMDRFYHHLRNGEGRLHALRQAQAEIRRQHPDVYAWAGFICQGDTGPLF